MNLTGQLMRADYLVANIVEGRVRPFDPLRMPLHLDHGSSFASWLASRALESRRRNARVLKRLLALDEADDLALVLSVHAATVTDHYWFKTKDSLTWEDVRYRSGCFASAALSGKLPRSGDQDDPARHSPQLTVPGASEKAWMLEGNHWVLYKRGNVQERYSELLTYALGKALGLSVVKYAAARGCVKSRDFTKGVYDFEPAAAVVGEDADELEVCRALEGLHPGLTRPYLDILYLDALVHNPARDRYDYGFLRDWQTGDILGMAPNFDNNGALIACGFASTPIGSDGTLIDRFRFLYRRVGKGRPLPPPLPEKAVRRLADSVLPESRLDRNYVVAFLLDRQARLQEGM